MDKEYEMDNQNRGFALVINNKHFPGDEVRHGSEKDVKSIKEALKSLEFNIQVYEDYTASKMKDLMNQYGRMDHEENDCIVCVIMSHGSENTIEGVDGELVEIDELTKPFKENPSLNGKPKIFFIQACRGREEMNSMPNATLGLSPTLSKKKMDSCVQADTRLGTSNQLKETDVFIHYSTVHGYVAYRNPDSGSWFIQSLASTLLEKGQTESLKNLTIEVNSKVVKYCKQCPNINHTLLKDVYFRPKKKLYFQNFEDGRYEGNYLNGKRHGKGTCYHNNGNKYTGEWNNDKEHGKGVFYFASGDRYEGHFLDGKYHGKGTFYWSDGKKYTGDWANGDMAGKGQYYYANGDFYDGNFVNNKKQGTGTYYYKNGDKYTGNWNNDKQTGTVKFNFHISHHKYEGDFLDGNFHGKGTLYYSNGNQYTGDWNNGERTGKGVSCYANGNRYEGDFLDGKMHGKGTFYWSDGAKYTGDWNNGERTGKGVYYSGIFQYEGDFLYGKIHGNGTLYYRNGGKSNRIVNYLFKRFFNLNRSLVL